MMHPFRRPLMATLLPLSTLLWRSTASSSSRSLLIALSSPSRPLSSARRLAFQNNHATDAFRRPQLQHQSPIIATAFSNNGKRSSGTTLITSRSTSRSTYLKSTTPSQVEGASSTSTTTSKDSAHKPIPTILLAGFLGSGKTSALKHLLENNSNIKIGTIVNDVASVNIDAKLISNISDPNRNGADVDGNNFLEANAEGVVELQNGCACCSLKDELFASVERLTRGGERELDAIVVELSGVADPSAVRENWEDARLQGHPATRIATLSRTVTVIDACTFGTDWMTWDTAGERPYWTESEEACEAVRNVPELLAEQVEAADLLLVNKIDLAGEDQVGVATGVARGLNDKAEVMEVEFGRVGAGELLGKMMEKEEVEEEEGHSHGHEHSSHDHSHEHSSHDHSHEHSAKHDDEASACTEPDCTDTSHSHSHEHSSSECNEPDCTDPSHSHSHEHTSECEDPDCTDTSHSHSHDHKSATAADQLGITSFVYSASTPFNSQRLLTLLNRWPVPIKDSLDFGLVMDMGDKESPNKAENQHPAFRGVLRSKGFCWMAPMKWSSSAGNGDVWRHDTAMYWSHAGKHFGITTAGKWWATLTKEQMKPNFVNNQEEYERILREDWVSEEWGDRRQELVFIGSRLDEEEIREALDECLCTEEEMVAYRAQLRSYLDAIAATAPNPLM
mmetsp:Transcript_10539/g.19148  ORF Transcript_10539/g.19148 Transcript_10539/m.19148 type:complete len:677 (+) Transcript_10539:86-2116(+)